MRTRFLLEGTVHHRHLICYYGKKLSEPPILCVSCRDIIHSAVSDLVCSVIDGPGMFSWWVLFLESENSRYSSQIVHVFLRSSFSFLSFSAITTYLPPTLSVPPPPCKGYTSSSHGTTFLPIGQKRKGVPDQRVGVVAVV
jgi:hypothetical protein